MYSINPDGSRTNKKVDSLNFVHSDLQKAKGFKNLVDISDEFHYKYKSSNNYISVTGNKDKWSNENIRNLIVKQMEIEYPMVDIADDGNIRFIDGSHRYSIANRFGLDKKVCMKDECLNNAKKFNYVKE